jgi:hypothetical protein
MDVLLVVAWWVVAGLPLLLVWRASQLIQMRNEPALFILGSWCIIIGVLPWIPFCWLKRIQGQDISVLPYLITHLSFVIPGFVIKRIGRKQRTVVA